MRVPITNAFPHWQGYVNGIEQANVFYTIRPLSGPNLNLLSSSLGDLILQGTYTAFLHSSPMDDVTISQFGHIPNDAQSLRFLGSASYSAAPPPPPFYSLFGVFIDGQRLAVTDAFSVPGLFNYSADISTFAGTDATLSFTSLHYLFYEGLRLDGISFSSEPVPEPSPLALFAVAGVLVWFRHRRKTRWVI